MKNFGICAQILYAKSSPCLLQSELNHYPLQRHQGTSVPGPSLGTSDILRDEGTNEVVGTVEVWQTRIRSSCLLIGTDGKSKISISVEAILEMSCSQAIETGVLGSYMGSVIQLLLKDSCFLNGKAIAQTLSIGFDECRLRIACKRASKSRISL